jgi:hypothetical protein
MNMGITSVTKQQPQQQALMLAHSLLTPATAATAGLEMVIA